MSSMSLLLALIDEKESYLLLERPVKQSIVIALHYNNIQGQVGRFAAVPALKISLQSHFVTVLRGVEGRAEYSEVFRRGHCLLILLFVIGDFPDEHSVCTGTTALVFADSQQS